MIPPDTRERARATAHGLFNLGPLVPCDQHRGFMSVPNCDRLTDYILARDAALRAEVERLQDLLSITNELRGEDMVALNAARAEIATLTAALANYNESTAAYLTDRGDQYDTKSPCWIALTDAAEDVINGEVEAAAANGDLDDELLARVRKWRRK